MKTIKIPWNMRQPNIKHMMITAMVNIKSKVKDVDKIKGIKLREKEIIVELKEDEKDVKTKKTLSKTNKKRVRK